MKTELYSTSLTILVSVLSWSTIAGTNTDLVHVDNDDIGYSDGDEFGDLQKRRLSNFVRIGRGLSSFIRIGRNGLYLPYDDDSINDDLEEIDDDSQGTSAFDNAGKGGLSYPEKRISSFVRIGRGMADPDIYRPYEKRAGAFIRVGKFPSSGYYRSRFTGNKSPYYRRTGRIGHSSFIRIGKRDTSNTLKNQAKEDEYDRYMQLEKELAQGNLPDLAEDTYNYNDIKSEDKKMSSFVRIGRPSSFVRIGRPSSFVRIGRPSSFVRIGKALVPGQTADEEVPSRYDLFEDDGSSDNDEQKRMSKFVRIGKDKELINDEIFKRRLSNFVRIGKRKDANSYNSIGDSDIYRDDVKRRMSSFVRIGKSGSEGVEDKNHAIDIVTEMKDENQGEPTDKH